MRLWSIHPQYLDTKGLLAAWREGLLAQHVLAGKTKGYKNHPQLDRFKESKDPLGTIGSMLFYLWEEANARGYTFNREKIVKKNNRLKIAVTDGQIEFEMIHLKRKLKKRDAAKYKEVQKIKKIELNPLFYKTKGPIAFWEKV